MIKRAESASAGRVFLVGDALLEPFWPEGLGVVRGFLTVLDAVAAIALLAEDKDDEARALVAKTSPPGRRALFASEGRSAGTRCSRA